MLAFLLFLLLNHWAFTQHSGTRLFKTHTLLKMKYVHETNICTTTGLIQ